MVVSSVGMAHVFLDDPEVDPGLQEMGGIGVAQGVDGDLFFRMPASNLALRKAPWTLDLAMGVSASWAPCSASCRSPGKRAGVAVGGPVLAERLQSGIGQRDIAVLGSLAAMDVDHHALAVDVGDFQVLGLPGV